MALQTKYEFEDIILSDAYIRISKVRSANNDYEELSPVDDPNAPNIAFKTSWMMRVESSATAFVWADKLARDNRTIALSWFDFDFDYDLNSGLNIYQQAYNALKATERFKDAVDV